MGPRLALLVAVLGAFAFAGYNQLPEAEVEDVVVVDGELRPIDAASTGSIAGTVRYDGVVPDLEELRLFNGCENGTDEPLYADTFLVSDGQLQNAFVWPSPHPLPPNNACLCHTHRTFTSDSI